MLLALALQVYGFAALVATVLGPAHFHGGTAQPRAADEPMAGWQDFRRAHHVGDAVMRGHEHGWMARHHHDPAEPGVVRIGADERDGALDDAAASGLPPLVLALPGGALPIPVWRREAGAGWSTHGACAFASCPQRRLERPPMG